MNAVRVLAVAMLVCLAAPAAAQDKKPDAKPKEIDKATIAAWEKRGFRLYTIADIPWSFPSERVTRGQEVQAFYPMKREIGSLKDLPRVEGEFGLKMGGSEITDDQLKDVAALTNLVALDLSNCKKVTDEGLKHLASLKQLRILDLSDTQLTGAGLKHLAGLDSLYALTLSGPGITDEGFRSLADLKNLSMLFLGSVYAKDPKV